MKKKLLLVVGIVTAVVVVGAAYAYWTQGGSGVGSATADTTTAITVNQTNTVTGLFPGGPAATLSGDFDNPNAADVELASVTAVVSSVSNGTSNGSKPACTSADFQIGGSTGSITVPTGGAGVGSWTGLTIALKNTASNQDNCKSATANITYTANPLP